MEYEERLITTRALCEQYIETHDYDHFSEIIGIMVEELHNYFEAGNVKENNLEEVNFYFKYFGYDDDYYIDKFSKNGYSLELDKVEEYEEEYLSSDFTDTHKFHKEFSREFKKLKKKITSRIN